jgi:hypothetical protein
MVFSFTENLQHSCYAWTRGQGVGHTNLGLRLGVKICDPRGCSGIAAICDKRNNEHALLEAQALPRFAGRQGIPLNFRSHQSLREDQPPGVSIAMRGHHSAPSGNLVFTYELESLIL